MLISQRNPRLMLECSLLSQVNLLMPFAPHLCGSEHATGTALVTESSLTSTVRTTTRDTRNTGNSTACKTNTLDLSFFPSIVAKKPIIPGLYPHTSTPRLGRGLFTSLLAHSIGLSPVLRDTSVHRPNHQFRQQKNCPSSPQLRFSGIHFSYWTISGRIGALKTLGRG